MAIDQEGKILDRASLRRWLRKGALTITYLDKIKQAGKNVDHPVAIEGMEKFTADPHAKQPMMPIVRPLS